MAEIIYCPTGVFGTLELYGLPRNVYRTKLAATANAGSNTLTLSQSVDWQVCIVSSRMCYSIFLYYVLHSRVGC